MEIQANLIRQEFDGFAAAVIPETAGENQKKATETAFFAGALSLFKLLVADDKTEDEMFIIMDGLQTELEVYATSHGTK